MKIQYTYNQNNKQILPYINYQLTMHIFFKNLIYFRNLNLCRTCIVSLTSEIKTLVGRQDGGAYAGIVSILYWVPSCSGFSFLVTSAQLAR